jgi:uncharacterized damage-inducible protein DinB
MTVKDLQRLYDYGYWANRKLFLIISRLTPEEFTQFLDGSHGSIRNTMVHILSAEWGWLSRCGGPDRGPALKPEDYPTPESLLETWRAVEGYVRTFLSGLSDDDLGRSVEFANPAVYHLRRPVKLRSLHPLIKDGQSTRCAKQVRSGDSHPRQADSRGQPGDG